MQGHRRPRASARTTGSASSPRPQVFELDEEGKLDVLAGRGRRVPARQRRGGRGRVPGPGHHDRGLRAGGSAAGDAARAVVVGAPAWRACGRRRRCGRGLRRRDRRRRRRAAHAVQPSAAVQGGAGRRALPTRAELAFRVRKAAAADVELAARRGASSAADLRRSARRARRRRQRSSYDGARRRDRRDRPPPRRPGPPPRGAGRHVVRTLDDAVAAARRRWSPARRVVVLGAGFIGCEVAATARTLGCQVDVGRPSTRCR